MDYTSIDGLMSPVPEHRGAALLQLLQAWSGVAAGRLVAFDAQGRHITVAALDRRHPGPNRDPVLTRRLGRVGALHLSLGPGCPVAPVDALTPHFTAVAEMVSRRVQLGLTNRERDILGAVAEGHTNAEIARRECVAVRTVTTHVEAIFRKLRVTNRVQAARVAIDCGVVGDQRAGLTSAQGLAAS